MGRFWRLEDRAAGVLLAAGVVVGVAIALDGAAARAINGVSGILWFAAAALFVRLTLRQPGRWLVLLGTVAIGLTLVIAIRPSDLLWAAAGFGAGGAAVALLAVAAGSGERERAALLLPALWLPLHLLVAVGRAVERAVRDLPAHVRTEPPPTAALVPLAMIVAAYAGGLLAAALLQRRSGAARRIPGNAGD